MDASRTLYMGEESITVRRGQDGDFYAEFRRRRKAEPGVSLQYKTLPKCGNLDEALTTAQKLFYSLTILGLRPAP